MNDLREHLRSSSLQTFPQQTFACAHHPAPSTMTRRLALVVCAVSSLALAQDESPGTPIPAAPAPIPAAEPAKSPVKQLDEFRYQIGGVTLNQRTREIRIPTKVNRTAERALEYLLVMPQGKTHESLLVTEISPTHLNLAFTLLRYRASPELFYQLDAKGEMTDNHPVVPAAAKAAARIDIDVEWDDHGTTRRIPVNEWIQQVVKTTAMAAGPWLYTGSEISDGQYLPEMTGDIAAIMVDPSNMINYPGSDNGDNVWCAYPNRVPPPDTPVTLIITPHTKTITPSKP